MRTTAALLLCLSLNGVISLAFAFSTTPKSKKQRPFVRSLSLTSFPNTAAIPRPLLSSPHDKEDPNNKQRSSSHLSPSSFLKTNHPRSLASILLAGSIFFQGMSFLPTTTTTQSWTVANAEAPRVVGQISGSGLVFKDTLQIEAFPDPKVQGVTLYVSTFQKPITERLSSIKSLLSDPSQASVACAKTGDEIKLATNIARGTTGEPVFEESRSILFKSLRVQRIYDEESNALVYVSFNTRLDKGDDTNKSRFKSSLCAIGLNDGSNKAPTSATVSAEATSTTLKP